MKGQVRASSHVLWIVALALMSGSLSGHADDDKTLVSGWRPYPPYSYLEEVQGIPRWIGLDVELLHEIANRAGYSIEPSDAAWHEQVEQIRTGERDLAAQATLTPEREAFAIFSDPYRSETMAFIVPRGQSASYPARTDAELVGMFKERKIRLGVDPGTAYPSAAVRAFVADPANRAQLFEISETELLQELLDGHIDGYLSDRIVAANIIEAVGAGRDVEEHPLLVDGEIHLMFSKASVPPEVVDDFNRAIESVVADGTYRELNEKYSFPILVRLTVNSDWFLTVDILGTIAFALSGLLLAFRYNYDIFGALVLASLPAVGGGVVRDLLTNRETLAVLASPIYIEIVVVLVVGGYAVIRLAMALRQYRLGAAAAGLLKRRHDQVDFLVQVFDAVGLAAFTVTGVVVALATQSRPLLLWGPILAAITAAGGGILRDVVRSDPNVPSLKGELYPEIAVLWGLLLSAYFELETRRLDADQVALGIVVTFVGAFLTRVAIIYFGIRSPRFPAG